MIVSAAIVPHSPLLLPSIGKEHREKLTATLAGYEKIEHAIYLSKPDTFVVIAPHGPSYPDAFSINLASKYTGTLKDFGDFSTTFVAKSDYLLIDRLQRDIRGAHLPFTLTSSEEINYGVVVPLVLLTAHMNAWKLIPISPSDADGPTHFAFGEELHQVLHGETTRVALIASIDLSHKVNAQSPGGPTPEGAAFDKAVQDTLHTTDHSAFLHLNPETLQAAAQCGYGTLATFLGAMHLLNTKTTVHSYEAPFGVGYLTAQIDVM